MDNDTITDSEVIASFVRRTICQMANKDATGWSGKLNLASGRKVAISLQWIDERGYQHKQVGGATERDLLVRIRDALSYQSATLFQKIASEIDDTIGENHGRHGNP